LGKKVASRYRLAQNAVIDPETEEVLYLPPEAKQVPKLMKSLIVWIKQHPDLPPPLLAAIVHLGINAIHPFYDGNGRTARLLTRWLLSQHGYDIHGLVCIEEYYVKNLAHYYRALEEATLFENRPITKWLEYFCKGLLHAYRKALRIVNN
jgi:Fic family protein